MCVCVCRSSQGDDGPLSVTDEGGKIERLITPDTAGGGHSAALRERSSAEGRDGDPLAESLSRLGKLRDALIHAPVIGGIGVIEKF